MKQEHHPKGVRLNNRGANTSDEKILMGAGDNGEYYDSNNARLRSLDGDEGDLIKIKGEEVRVSDVFPGNWTCIYTDDVNGRRFEVWVEDTGAGDPIIRIDDTIVAQSPDILWEKAFPLQGDKNEGCDRGEVFLTDYNTTPLHFDIGDMLDNALE